MEIDLCAIAPENWEIKSVANICRRVTSGGTPSRREPAYYDGGVWPWVKTQELQDGWIDDTDEHITEAAIAASSAKVLPSNTILLAMYGATVGQLGILRRPMTCNQACCALIADPDKADFRFLYFQLLQIRPELKKLATGAAQQNLSGNLIKTLRLPFPPIEEQRAIAHILGTLDDKIELNRKQNATLEAMARALFKAWFVDFEPVRAKMEGRWQRGQSLPGLPAHLYDLFPNRLVESELGEIPEGWVYRPLSEFAELKGGKQLEKEKIASTGSIPVFGGAGVMGYTDTYNADGFVIAVGRIGAFCGQFFSHRGKAWINNNASLIKQTDDDLAEWLFLALSHADIDIIKKGAAQPFVSNGDVAKLPLMWPTEALVNAFTDIVSPVQEEKDQHNQESRTLAQLRDTLLPKLISGEIRVKDAERFLKERGL